MELSRGRATHTSPRRLIRLLDPFGETGQAGSRMWTVSSVIRLSARLAQFAYQKVFFVTQWYLLFDLGDEISISFSAFREIVPPKDRFWADPHIIRTDDRYFIFVEEFIPRLKKGHISVIEMDEHGNYEDPVRVLERQYHLSYPCVFEWQGKHYMVPESAANRSVELYECVEFPWRWKLKMTLMEDVVAVDPTLFHYDGRWWLFTGMAEDTASLPWVRLFLFFSEDLLTNKWNSHPLNPIVADVRKGRPAGGLLTIDGRILRPSQDCSRGYGYGFDLNEILLLSDTEYLERNVLSVRPGWDQKARGSHTFARDGQLSMIDASMRRSRL